MNFSHSQGRVYKTTSGPKGFKQTLSSKEEAIESQLPFEFTALISARYTELLEHGFEYIQDIDGTKLYRKRK